MKVILIILILLMTLATGYAESNESMKGTATEDGPRATFRSVTNGQVTIVGEYLHSRSVWAPRVKLYRNGVLFHEGETGNNEFLYLSPPGTFKNGDELKLQIVDFYSTDHHWEKSMTFNYDPLSQLTSWKAGCRANSSSMSAYHYCVENEIPYADSFNCYMHGIWATDEIACMKNETTQETAAACYRNIQYNPVLEVCLGTVNLSEAKILKCLTSPYVTEVAQIRCLANASKSKK